ncbi:MAG: substrate-binding domain-containing protein [Bacteroidales bacterium]|nr:substrate-binding domain-containing protein [Bacteroidales bacterium]
MRYFLFMVIFIISGCGPRTSDVTAGDKMVPPGSQNLTGKITISGAYALAPLAEALAVGYKENNPGVEFEVTTTGTGAGLDAITNGEIRLAMVSRSLKDEEREAGYFPVPIAKDAVVLIVNRDNPYLKEVLDMGLDPKTLALLYTGEGAMTWGDLLGVDSDEKVNLFTRGDISGAAELWAGFLFRTQADLKGTKVNGDVEMVERIQGDRFAMGFCNLIFAYDAVTRMRKDNVQVVPIDLDYDRKISSADQPYETLEKIHRAIYLGLYPHALCRKLCLVSMGRPEDPLLVDFLRWTLTEGQTHVSPTGYCEFNHAEKKLALEVIQ